MNGRMLLYGNKIKQSKIHSKIGITIELSDSNFYSSPNNKGEILGHTWV